MTTLRVVVVDPPPWFGLLLERPSYARGDRFRTLHIRWCGHEDCAADQQLAIACARDGGRLVFGEGPPTFEALCGARSAPDVPPMRFVRASTKAEGAAYAHSRRVCRVCRRRLDIARSATRRAA